MSNRLTRITTGNGDAGSTTIAGGKVISKSSLRIDAIGDVDELNAAIGVLVAALKISNIPSQDQDDKRIIDFCVGVQNELFNIGGELASPSNHYMSDDAVERLENMGESLNAELPPLKEFVVPGQNLVSAHAHLARCVTRRAERSVVRLSEEESVSTQLLVYLNRLSDVLFIISRVLGRQDSTDEPQWTR